MPVFAYSIAADPHGPSEGDGFVRAETIQEAAALVGHPEVNVYPLPADAVWPGDPGEAVWQCGKVPVSERPQRSQPPNDAPVQRN